MMTDLDPAKKLRAVGAFDEKPVMGLVDGQFGSTGKGLIAGLIASAYWDQIGLVTSNAGPNSGHTSYLSDGRKVVLTQLPTTAVHLWNDYGVRVNTQMNAGAVIAYPNLQREVLEWAPKNRKYVVAVHPNAALVTEQALRDEGADHERIGSTAKGTGAAIARKIRRIDGSTFGSVFQMEDVAPIKIGEHQWGIDLPPSTLVEVSQGFSLGVNQHFWPYCTSRECTIGQALSDAGIHPSFLGHTIMAIRTYPIRVAGNSGPCYPDQQEVSWEYLGVEPELTTVTQKVRRVFSFSWLQFHEALVANRPSVLFVNFCNYFKEEEQMNDFMERLMLNYYIALGRNPKLVLCGFGPKTSDIRVWE